MPAQAGLRLSLAMQSVLRALLDEGGQEAYGLQIRAATGLPGGTVHPILARLDGLGWLESRWEDEDPREQGRPRRRYCRLTPDGAEHARAALARLRLRLLCRDCAGCSGG